MSESEDITARALDSLGAGPAAHELYKDLLQPAARELGKSLLPLAKAVSLAMTPLRGAVWGLEQIEDWLSVKITQKLSRSDPRNIHAPKMSIAGPILLNMHFCKDEEDLRELFANLLASSMNKEVSQFVHP